MTKSHLFIIFCLTAILMLGNGCPLTCPTAKDNTSAVIGAIGDSILAGGACACMASRTEGTIPILAGGMPLYLENINSFEIANWSVGGACVTRTGVLNIPGQLSSLMTARPTVEELLVIGGINDVVYAESAGELDSERIDAIKDGMVSLFDEISIRGLRAIVHSIHALISSPPGVTAEGLERINNAIVEINLTIEEAASLFNFDYFDFYEFMSNNPSYYANYIHLTCEGYQAWAEEIDALFY